jgi:ORF6N domain
MCGHRPKSFVGISAIFQRLHPVRHCTPLRHERIEVAMPNMTRRKTSTAYPLVTHIARTILVLRGQRVLVDSELAAVYGVTTKRLNEQVKRNTERFPEDFLFRLTATETVAVNRSQSATGSQKHRDPRFPPFAFTEHGAIMAATPCSRPSASS